MGDGVAGYADGAQPGHLTSPGGVAGREDPAQTSRVSPGTPRQGPQGVLIPSQG